MLSRQFRDRSSPQAGRCKHICLVHGGHLSTADLCGLKGELRDALHLGDGIVLQIPGALRPIVLLRLTTVAEIDAAHQLTHDHKIHALDQLRLQRGIFHQRVRHLHRTQIRIEPQPFAQAQNRFFRAQGRLHAIPFFAAHRTEQDRVRLLACLQRAFRQRRAEFVISGSARVMLLIGKPQPELFICFFQNLDSRARDFSANAIARNDYDFFHHAFLIYS